VLCVNHIFYSLQGESTYVGSPCVFIRLTGCNLRCAWCDTQYAYEEGRHMTVASILEEAETYRCNLVEVTGGEPLLQQETPQLIQDCLDRGMHVLVETNGTQDISLIPEGAVCVMDIKCPSSGESKKIDWANVDRLKGDDEVKFALAGRTDYDWATNVIREHNLTDRVTVLFSPIFRQLDPNLLAQWILDDCLVVRLQVQLHKILWPDQERGR